MISKRTQQVIADGKFLTAFEGLASWLQERLEQEIVLERQRQERAATLQHILESVNSKPTLPASPGLDLTKHLPSFDPGIIEAEAWLKVIKHPSVALIMGKRGSGKSGLGHRLLEHLRHKARPYVIGLPKEARVLLPDWLGMAPSLEDVKGSAIILVDEAYIPYHARAGTTAGARAMSQAVNLSRQKEQTLIFVTQEARQIDKNIASSANVVIFKDPGIIQLKFDRRELNEIAAKANEAFAAVRGDKRQWSFVYAPDTGFVGLLQNTLPAFWNKKLSHVFAIGGEAATRAPQKEPLSQRIEKAKELRKQGLSQGKIARLMGISRPTIKNWLEGYPYKVKPS
jgi:DNA-binding XRE family transcriptional regulator